MLSVGVRPVFSAHRLPSSNPHVLGSSKLQLMITSPGLSSGVIVVVDADVVDGIVVVVDGCVVVVDGVVVVVVVGVVVDGVVVGGVGVVVSGSPVHDPSLTETSSIPTSPLGSKLLPPPLVTMNTMLLTPAPMRVST